MHYALGVDFFFTETKNNQEMFNFCKLFGCLWQTGWVSTFLFLLGQSRPTFIEIERFESILMPTTSPIASLNRYTPKFPGEA